MRCRATDTGTAATRYLLRAFHEDLFDPVPFQAIREKFWSVTPQRLSFSGGLQVLLPVVHLSIENPRRKWLGQVIGGPGGIRTRDLPVTWSCTCKPDVLRPSGGLVYQAELPAHFPYTV